MSRLTGDEHSVEIDGTTVTVTGRTGLVQATWTLAIGGEEVDSAKASGDFRLRGQLPDGSAVVAEVFQSLIGPTEVAILHADEEVARLKGFVA